MIEELKQEIHKHYIKSDLNNLKYGMTWYMRAHNECLLLSEVFDIPFNKVVGVVAALSPNNRWQQNLKDAWNFLETPSIDTKVCTFKNQRRKALAILQGGGRIDEITKILNGEKTKKFFTNIVNYDTSEDVTVDIWAYRSVGLEPKKKYYKLIEQAYQESAKQLGMLPHQLQAIVWGVVRGGIV